MPFSIRTTLATVALCTVASPCFAQEADNQIVPIKISLNLPFDVQPPNPAGQPVPTAPLTLSQAIEIALTRQPNVAVALANRQGSEQRLKQAQAQYVPRVTPQYTYVDSYTFGRVNQFVGTGTVVSVNQARSSVTKQANLGLSYRVWDSGSRDLTARQARQSLRSSFSSEDNTRQNVIGTVSDAYFSALRTSALVKVSEAQVARAQNTLDATAARIEVGDLRKIDQFQAQADLLNAKVALLNAQNNAANAQAQLKNALGILSSETVPLANVPSPDTNALPTATLQPKTGEPTPLPDPTDFAAIIRLNQQFVDVAFRDRPDLLQTRQGIEANETGVKLAKVNAGLLLTADLAANEQFDPSGLNSVIGNNRQIQLGLSYPLIDGGAARAQVRLSQATVRSSKAQLNVQRQQVAVEVEQTFRTLNQTRATIPASFAAQDAAQQNYDAARESLREGTGSIIDVITAQTQLVQAQTNYIQAVYDYYTADARLARAIGQAYRIATNSPANGR